MSDGLDGVVACQTVLSHNDSETGRVLVRGVPITELVEQRGYEGTIALMWEGFVGDHLTRDQIVAQLGAGRVRAFSHLEDWLPSGGRRQPIDAMRMCLAATPQDATPAEIIAALPVGIAALLRKRAGKPPVPPDPTLTTAADLLRMASGRPAEPRFATALDNYLTTVIDNGLGASTFAARVVIATLAPLAAAVEGAYACFVGERHGGAPGLALDMLDAIEASGDIDGWLDRTLAASGRLMGFGHRVYRIRDPRADMLRAALLRLDPAPKRLAFAQEVERRAVAALQRRKPGRRLEANIEMDAALLLDAIGLPREAFTPVFAVARSPAWIAHALEQRRTGRMIRPASAYIGPN